LLTLHEVGKGIFYMRNVPKSHEECNACPQFRVLQLSENRDARPSRYLGDGSQRAQGAAGAHQEPFPGPRAACAPRARPPPGLVPTQQLPARGQVGVGLGLGVGYQLNGQGAGGAPSGPLTSSCAPGARPPPQLAGATDGGGMYIYMIMMGGDGWGGGWYHGCGYG